MFLRTECAGSHALASVICCVLALLQAACRVYDRDATRSRISSAQSAADAGNCIHDAACGGGCAEVCNGHDDDCDGRIDEGAAESCILPHAQAVCIDGACLLARCSDGHRDCDQENDNGCEVAPDDIEHCVQCQKVCTVEHGSPRCTQRRCEVDTCEPGYGDCDQNASDCETSLDSDQHCGACGERCTRLPHANAQCQEGSCRVTACDRGFGDCDEDPSNGCERRLDTLSHCGGCNVACDKISCGGGVCSRIDCSAQPNTADCDDDGLRCEVELANDVDHCGACQQACRFLVELPHAKAMCSEGGCRAECDAGYDDCDGQFQNGCETSLLTALDCGKCGNACQFERGQGQCVDGRCELQLCDQGYADCDRDQQSCERSLSDALSCGTCARRCAFAHAQARCGSNMQGDHICELTQCDAGWDNCDGALDNGCERDVRPAAEGGSGPCLPDLSCSGEMLQGRQYYFCSAQLAWIAARQACQRLLGGDLAELRDAATRTALQSRVTARAWISHNSNVSENVWVWANSNVAFWRGGASGDAIKGAYSRWARGEPNRSGRCGALTPEVEMDDLTCSTPQPFICEISPDQCPEDPGKVHPGQCGCGVTDTDADRDGIAECPD